MKTLKRQELGQYIVADPDICHGQLTFKGTRIMVKSVLEMLAKGYDWDRISAEYDGRINHEAIAEVLSLASATPGESCPHPAQWSELLASERAKGAGSQLVIGHGLVRT